MDDPAGVRVEEDGGVLVITIDRPEQRPAMTRAASVGIAEASPSWTSGRTCRCPSSSARVAPSARAWAKRFLACEVASIPGRGFGGLTQAPPAKRLLGCDLVVAGSPR